MSLLLANVIIDGRKSNIAVENSRITAVGPDIVGKFDQVIDGGGHLAATVPFYNTHTHCAMTLLRGYADDLELFTWLNEHIWPAEAKMDAGDIYAGCRLGILEMIKSGCCYFNEMYWHLKETVRAAGEMGVRADVGLLHLSAPGVKGDKSAGQLREETLAYREILPVNVRLAMAPHAIYTVSAPALAAVAETATELDMPLHIHCSETVREVEECRAAHDGLTPVEYLDTFGLINENMVLAHCVHLTDHDREIIAGRKALIAHCPVSNMKLCSGVFDFDAALKAGCRISIGTDGAASNNNLSMFDEMKFAALSAKLKSNDPTAGKASDILRSATSAGALYCGADIGIAPGKDADIMLVELDECKMVGDYDFAANLVYSADSSVVDTLICAGRVLMQGHHVPGEEEIIAEARRCCDKFRR